MKKNLLWMLFALVVGGVMTTSCSKEETTIEPIDQNQNQNQQPEEQDETPVNPVSVKVKYEVKSSETVIANYNLVSKEVLVRYVDVDGKVKSEPFTGSFTKTVTVPITSTGMNIALQLLMVLKDKEEIEFGEGINVTTDMKFTWSVNFDNKTQSDEIVFSSTNGYCNARSTLPETNYDSYVPKFGGFVPAMAHLGYSVEEVENHTTIVGPTFLAASFWKDNAYTVDE